MSALFISVQVLPWTMKPTLSFLLVFLLSAQCSVGSVAGDLSLLTDAGQTDSLDRPLVLFSELNDGSVLTQQDPEAVAARTDQEVRGAVASPLSASVAMA